MSEHQPVSAGIVQEVGTFDKESSADQRLRHVAKKVEDHGEVHAQFTTVDKEVELRLGTLRVNYDADVFEVWDGDNYRTFPVSVLDYAYKPMETFH